MTTFLLDTHVALWMVDAPERLGSTTRSALERLDNQVLCSAASVWEVAIKATQGRLEAPDELWAEVAASGVTMVAIECEDAVAAGGLPTHHRDSFDRMLVAQAQRRSAVLVTVDDALAAYDVRLLDASL